MNKPTLLLLIAFMLGIKANAQNIKSTKAILCSG